MRSRSELPPFAARLRARARALVLLSVVLDLPVAARLVRATRSAPWRRLVEVDGVPVELLHPPGRGPFPSWLFVNGAHPERRREPVVTRLADGLARAGYLVAVPDLPGLGDGRITPDTLEATAAVTAMTVELPQVRGGRVALIGASTGASLALLVAARPELSDRISGVAAVAPFADLEKVVCLATTGCYVEGDAFARYAVTPLHRRVVAQSLAALLPPGADRTTLLAALAAAADDRDPLDGLDGRDYRSNEARTVVELLLNDEPCRFGELYAALPPCVRGPLQALSPLAASAAVRAPVEIVVPPVDVYFPLGEALALAGALPRGRLTITRTLDHTRPHVSLSRLSDLRRFDAFAVRGLAAAG